jgi:hypothetical protein
LFGLRSQAALKQKARCGPLVLGVAASYVKAGRERIEKNRISGCAAIGCVEVC